MCYIASEIRRDGALNCVADAGKMILKIDKIKLKGFSLAQSNGFLTKITSLQVNISVSFSFLKDINTKTEFLDLYNMQHRLSASFCDSYSYFRENRSSGLFCWWPGYSSGAFLCSSLC